MATISIPDEHEVRVRRRWSTERSHESRGTEQSVDHLRYEAEIKSVGQAARTGKVMVQSMAWLCCLSPRRTPPTSETSGASAKAEIWRSLRVRNASSVFCVNREDTDRHTPPYGSHGAQTQRLPRRSRRNSRMTTATTVRFVTLMSGNDM